MFADEIKHTPQTAVDVRAFRVLSVTADARIQRSLDVLWREHEVIACSDAATAGELALRLLDEGSDGVVVCGTTGESSSWVTSYSARGCTCSPSSIRR